MPPSEPKVRHSAWEESASPAQLAAPIMMADSPQYSKHMSYTKVDTGRWMALYRYCNIRMRVEYHLNQSPFWNCEVNCKSFLKTFLVVYLPVPFLLIPLTNCMHPPPFNKFKQIKTRLILWKYQVILIIAYIFIIKVMNNALWLTFESKHYMYFHNKTWYTCTRCYM